MDIQDFLSFESCRSSVVDDMEEVSSESKRKMQDKEETTKGGMEARSHGFVEISFVPSAISVPPKPLFRCDNRRSENTQFLAVCVGGGKVG